MSAPAVVDAHCHLDRLSDDELLAVIERARAAGVVHAVVVGQFEGPGDFGRSLEVQAKFPRFLTATMGIHPHEAARATDDDLLLLEALCQKPEVAAVGEAGLDFFYDRSPRDAQERVFRFQCQLSKRLAKPLVIHVRDAHQECHQILSEERITDGVIHCFTGDRPAAERYLSLGFYISLSGIVTYKKTEGLQDAVRITPLERLLVETDSPFLAPLPYRGKKNEPAWVTETLKKVAELKGVSPDELARQTTENAARVFGFSL